MSRVSLQQLLAHLPHDGLGARVFQARWVAKGLPTPASTVPASACYWDVRKTLTTATSTKAWGVLYWKGPSLIWPHVLLPALTRPTRQARYARPRRV